MIRFSPNWKNLKGTLKGSFEAHKDAASDPIRLFTGSYRVSIKPLSANEIKVTLYNETSLNSLLLHLPKKLGLPMDKFRSDSNWRIPFMTTSQTYIWTQKLN